MDMYMNQISRGFWVLLFAGLMIVGYLTLHETVPFLQKNTPGYPPFTELTKYIQPAIDTCSTDSQLAMLATDSTFVASTEPVVAEADTPELYLGGEKMLRFLESLQKLEQSPNRKVRIAYFGDSFIEGDLVTQSLRNDLQERFGGEGVGFVPITSPAAGFRKTIRQTASKAWQRHSFLQDNPTKYDFGISGELFLGPEENIESESTLWVRYEGQETYPKTREFQRVKLFYGKAEDASAVSPYIVRTIADKADTVKLQQKEPVNQVLLAQGKAEEIRLDFAIDQQLPIYGLSFESTQGVHLDNFAARGNSGMNLIDLSPVVLQRFNRHFNYDLVVLHYGLNVISKGRTNYSSYEKGMKRVIEHFKTNLPGADILLISVSDKSYKIDGKMKTDRCVPLLVEAQERIAQEMGVAFLNLYEEMGGANSMVKWVEQEPPLAHHDYTHANRRGAEKVSQLIGRFLFNEYETFVEAKPDGIMRPGNGRLLHTASK
jgi:hypothetical protein